MTMTTTTEPMTTDDRAPELLTTRYLISCGDCDSFSGSDWLAKAFSDADWHETMTGHECEIRDGDALVYRGEG